jgi:hypothetical protein
MPGKKSGMRSGTEHEVAQLAYTEPVGPLQLRGFLQPVPAFRLRALK